MQRVLIATLIAVVLCVAEARAQVIGQPQTAAATGPYNFDVSGVSSLTVTISGTWVGTFVPKADPDGTGPLTAITVEAQRVEADGSLTTVNSITGNGTYVITNPGFMRVVLDWTRTSGTASLTAVRGFGIASNATATIEGAELEVGAQPASDPHYVRCSDGSAAAPCAVTGPLTDAQLRATPIEVSGDFSSDGLTNAELRASAVPVTANAGTNLNTSALLTTTAFDGVFGTAGTPDAQVLTVQGITSMTPFSVTFPSAQAVTQSGTWNLTNISGTISLPTGAATAANQSTGNTSLALIDNIPNTIGSTTSGQSGVLGLGAVSTSAPTYTNGQSHPVSLQTDGSIRVAVTNSSSGGTSLADDGDVTPGTTAATPVSALYESTVTACTDGDACMVGITAQRTAKVTAFTAAGVEVPVASAGTGTINSTTQRITIATDDPVNDAAVATETTIDPPGTESANAQAVQGVTGGVALPTTADLTAVGGAPITESNPVPVGFVFGGAFIEPQVDAEDDEPAQAGGPQLMAECNASPNAVDNADAIRLQANCTTGALKIESATLSALLTSILGNSDPCRTGTKLVAHIDQASGEQVITGTASNRTYICAVNLTTGAEQSIAIVSGTGTVCGTSTGPLFGGVSAATGWVNLTKGIVIGNGAAWIAKSDTDADNVCVLQSGSDQVSGSIVYVVAAN